LILNKGEIDPKTVQEAAEFVSSKCTMDEAYAALGMQLEAVDAINSPASVRTWMSAGVDVTKAKPKTDYKQKAIDFLKRFGANILKNTCDWWKNNRDKAGDTQKIIGGLTPILSAAIVIPQPWGAIVGIVALIIAILIKAGLDTVCATGKGKAILPWL
jgi:hypothetical protein